MNKGLGLLATLSILGVNSAYAGSQDLVNGLLAAGGTPRGTLYGETYNIFTDTLYEPDPVKGVVAFVLVTDTSNFNVAEAILDSSVTHKGAGFSSYNGQTRFRQEGVSSYPTTGLDSINAFLFARYGIPPPRAATGIDDKVMPEGIEISRNYPNPFNPTTTFNYNVKGQVNFQVYNSLGQILRNDVLEGKGHKVLDMKGQPSGVYYCRFGDKVFAVDLVK